MLQCITKLLNFLKIKFVIVHGNLIEYIRDKPIYHDDDIDIRYDIIFFDILQEYIDNLKKNNYCDEIYNLKFSFKDNAKRMVCELLKFNNINDCIIFDNIRIPCDVVSNIYNGWIDYDINYDDINEIEYIGIKTYVPNELDIDHVLKKEYGKNYLIPYPKYKLAL